MIIMDNPNHDLGVPSHLNPNIYPPIHRLAPSATEPLHAHMGQVITTAQKLLLVQTGVYLS